MERHPQPPPTSKSKPWLLFAGVVGITVVLGYWKTHDEPHQPAENTRTIDVPAGGTRQTGRGFWDAARFPIPSC